MPHHFIRKLENFVRLSADEKASLERLERHKRSYAAGEDIAVEGEPPGRVNLVLSGWACRHRALSDGRRQIVGLLLPGDLCDARVFVLKQMDHSISALTAATIARVDKDEFVATTDASARLTRALWWNTLVEESTAREWLVNMGQRTAFERMAHLFCEIFLRMRAVGLVQERTCDLPMTQAEISEILGLSAVHTNRTLQVLRAEGLLSLTRGRLEVLDLEGLIATAEFDANYLHLDREGAAHDANAV